MERRSNHAFRMAVEISYTSGEGKKEYNILLKSKLRRIGNGDQFLSWSLDDDLGAKRRRERNTEL